LNRFISHIVIKGAPLVNLRKPETLNLRRGDNFIDVIKNSWWLWLVPGVVITLFVLSINFIGDGLRDIMDPKQQ